MVYHDVNNVNQINLSKFAQMNRAVVRYFLFNCLVLIELKIWVFVVAKLVFFPYN